MVSKTKQKVDPMIYDSKTDEYIPNPAFVNDPNNEMIPSATTEGLWIKNPNYNGKDRELFSEHPVRLLNSFDKKVDGDGYYETGSEKYLAQKFPDGWHLRDGAISFATSAVENVDFEFLDND